MLTRKQIKKWKRRIFRVDLRFFLCYAISQSCASPHKCNFLLLVSADACYVTESTPSAALAWTHNTIESGGEKMEENRGRILNFLCIFSGVESERKNKNFSTHNGMELRRKKMEKVRIVHPPTPTQQRQQTSLGSWIGDGILMPLIFICVNFVTWFVPVGCESLSS